VLLIYTSLAFSLRLLNGTKIKGTHRPKYSRCNTDKNVSFQPLVRRLDEASICGLYLSERVRTSCATLFCLIHRISPEKITKFMHGAYESKFIVTGSTPEFRAMK
jgi:hypothetical protein